MLVLVLQITPDEVDIAADLVALLTDLEPVARKDCEFVLFYRKDVEFADQKRLMSRIETKFLRSKAVECWDFATGWPHGPNTMWCSLIRQLYHMTRMDELAANGALTFETDCIPIKPNWIGLLSAAWDEVYRNGKHALGHFHGAAPSHMNGNAIFRTDFWHLHEELTGCHGMIPWDVEFAPTILKVAVDTPLINQWYRLQEFTQEHWDNIAKTPCALFHGIKVPDGRRIAREQLLGPWPTNPKPKQATETHTSPKRSRRSKAKRPH